MTKSLTDWLDHIARHHPAEIELGLDRARLVFQRLLPGDWQIPTITIAGTNGKGSTIAYLDALARSAEHKVLTFTSPHLYDYRERLTLNGKWLAEEQHIRAFEMIAEAASDVPLTYFEFSTLSAFYLASVLDVDLLLLEVGLGGRLDATNLVAADIAIITTIDFDHQEYLGDTIGAIAKEKLGIIHPSTEAIIADDTVPRDLLDNLASGGILKNNEHYRVTGTAVKLPQVEQMIPLPKQIQPASNSAAALMAFRQYAPDLDLQVLAPKAEEILHLNGRMQCLTHKPLTYADVAHNPQAFTHLVSLFKSRAYQPCHLVLGMLADKQVKQCLEILRPVVSHWHLTNLDTTRAMPAEEIRAYLIDLDIPLDKVTCYASVQDAYRMASETAHSSQQTVLVTGSFYTVGPVIYQQQLDQESLQQELANGQ